MTIVAIEGKQESLCNYSTNTSSFWGQVSIWLVKEGTGLLGKMFQLAMKELFWVPLGCLAAL